MLFESITITLLATLWSAWNVNKVAIPETADSKNKADSSNKESEQNATAPLDEYQKQRRMSTLYKCILF